MAYLTVAQLKDEIGGFLETDLDHDTILLGKINAAVSIIEKLSGWSFEAATATRLYTPGVDTPDGLTLKLDYPLLSVTTLTNGDGAVIASTDYTLWPLNGSPKWRICLKASKGHSWTYTTDPEGAISVAGSWGLYTTPPYDVVQAVTELAHMLYEKRSAQTFDVTSDPETGQLVIPKGLPPLVYKVCRSYANLL